MHDVAVLDVDLDGGAVGGRQVLVGGDRQVGDPLGKVLADEHQMFEVRQFGRHGFEQRQELRLGDQNPRAGIAEDESHVLGGHREVHRQRHEPGPRAGEERGDEVSVVAAHDRDRFLVLRSQREQPAGQGVDPFVEFGIADLLVIVDQRGPGRELLRGTGEDVSEAAAVYEVGSEVVDAREVGLHRCS